MDLQLQDIYDNRNPHHVAPKEVLSLPLHPPLDLTPHMDKAMNKAYTCGRDVQVRDFITQLACQAGLALAVGNNRSAATRRAAIDAVLFEAVAIVASLSNLDTELLHITREQKMDVKQPAGQIDYSVNLVSAILIYMEAKGEADMRAFCEQMVSEMAAVRKSNLDLGAKHGWDATKDPTNGVCSNFLRWESYSSSQEMDPPVQFKTMTILTDRMSWQNVNLMIDRIRPVLEQLVGILKEDIGRMGDRMQLKRH